MPGKNPNVSVLEKLCDGIANKDIVPTKIRDNDLKLREEIGRENYYPPLRCTAISYNLPDILTFAREYYKFLDTVEKDELSRIARVVAFLLSCVGSFRIAEVTIGDYDGHTICNSALPETINELVGSYVSLLKIALQRQNLLPREIDAHKLIVRKSRDKYIGKHSGFSGVISPFRYNGYSVSNYITMYRTLRGQPGDMIIVSTTATDKYMRRVQANKFLAKEYPHVFGVSFLDGVQLCLIAGEPEIGMYRVYTFGRKFLLAGIGNLLMHGESILGKLSVLDHEKILSWLQSAVDYGIVEQPVFDRLKTFSKDQLISAIGKAK